ncbi:MAG: ABC transporter substrate-binding protein [Hyphomicrobiaceae bacterium]|nr:ABC transporter substrate-binding protein [Hyphomicrobiaceae bacterium]
MIRSHVRTASVAWLAALVCTLLPFALTSSPAQAGEAPAHYMQKVAKQLMAAARSSSQGAFAMAVRSHSDYHSIGLYSLGSYARGLPSSERQSYFTGMINFIAKYAATNAPKYPVASAVVTGQTEETKSGVHVDTKVTLTDGTSYDVRWLLVRRGSTWKVRDAQVLGFWMSPFLKNLFENYISENGGNPRALVVALNR